MAVDLAGVLELLSKIPIETWNYNSQDPSIRHMGPMAQDFHRAFGVGPAVGLSSLLTGSSAGDCDILPTAEPNLFLLPCGTIPENPVELLSGAGEFLDQLCGEFDLVVLDSPPVGVVSDACVLATMADRVLFVVRSMSTDRSMCRRAMQQLIRVDASIAGVILNHTDARADRYGRYQCDYAYLASHKYAD